MPRASTNNSAVNAVDASNPRIAWTVAVAALAILAGRELQRAGTCALHPRDEARAAALVEAKGGQILGREQSEGGQRRRAAQVGHGAASGAAPPTYFRPRRPRASPTRPRPSGDLSAAPATAPGAVKAHLYRGNPSGRLLE